MKKPITLFLVTSLGFILIIVFYSSAEERITLTTYYPAPYGIYRELRADQMAIGSNYRYSALNDGTLLVAGDVIAGNLTSADIILGKIAFTSVEGNDDCPSGYEIFTVRWKQEECSSSLEIPQNAKFYGPDIKCKTDKFVWSSSYVPECLFCAKMNKQLPKPPSVKEDAYTCIETASCRATEKEYTICVREP